MNRLGRALLLNRSLVRTRVMNPNATLLRPKVPLPRPSHTCPFTPSFTAKRPFHSSRPSQVPLIPFAGLFAGVVKSSSIINLVTFTSRASLTFLPYHLRKGKGASLLMALVMIPLIGSGVLVAVGLDKAPNTSRLRLIYLSKEEEEQVMREAMGLLRGAWGSDLQDDDAPITLWVKEIVDAIAKTTVDDVRAPVRKYDGSDLETEFDVHVVCDGETLNASCLGRNIVIYDKIMEAMEYDPNKLAAILAHELGHHLQRHTCEKFGMEALLYSINDMVRGFFWVFIEPLGPYLNDHLNTFLTGLVDAKVKTAYSRPLEVEADLIGLKLMAKAGFDPRAAIDVWEEMDRISKEADDDESNAWSFDDLEGYINQVYTNMFGSTHPYSDARAQYMRDHMDEAMAIYEESIKLNGAPNITAFEWEKEEEALEEEVEEEQEEEKPIVDGKSEGLNISFKSIFSRRSPTTATAATA